jgi:hypothetical protein
MDFSVNVVDVTSIPMMMLEKCNHVSNVQLAKGCEFVHHLI